MIVDDEATIRALLTCAVAAPGIEVCEAQCAEEALERAASQPPFDLVITDVMMPGMDGLDLAARLHSAGHAAKFLFISGFCDLAGMEDRVGGLQAQFLAKPFSIPELVRTVHGLLRERRPAIDPSGGIRRTASR